MPGNITPKNFRYPTLDMSPDVPRDLGYLAQDIDTYLTNNPGPQGEQGLQGVPGISINFKTSVATVAALPTTGNVTNDARIVDADGDVYVWGGSSWTSAGQIVGPQGAQGIPGQKGDKGDTGDTGQQGIPGQKGDKGDTGDTGAQGVPGPQGTGVTILGSYASLSALQSAHPTGSAGQGYLIVGELYVWSVTSSNWINVGSIQGPQGIQGITGTPGTPGAQGTQGVPGQKGDKGDTGDTGEQGIPGTPGAQGTQGVPGQKGDTGQSGGITLSVTNSGSGSYTINGSNNPTLSFIRGHRYVINVNASGHPFWIQTVSGAYSSANVYSTGLSIYSGTRDNGTIIFEVPFNAPQLYYACEYHPSMSGSITVSNLGPQGIQGIPGPEAVIADGSITNAKLANSSITVNGSAVSLGGSVTVASTAYSNGIAAVSNKIFYNSSGTNPTATAAGDIFIHHEA